MITRKTIGTGLLLACAATAAQAELVEIVWDSDGKFAQQTDIAAGKLIEVCGKLPAGLKVRWSFEATAPTDFNIHYHLGKDVVFPAKRSQVARGRDILQVKVERSYCWMWTNKTEAVVTVKASLQR